MEVEERCNLLPSHDSHSRILSIILYIIAIITIIISSIIYTSLCATLFEARHLLYIERLVEASKSEPHELQSLYICTMHSWQARLIYRPRYFSMKP